MYIKSISYNVRLQINYLIINHDFEFFWIHYLVFHLDFGFLRNIFCIKFGSDERKENSFPPPPQYIFPRIACFHSSSIFMEKNDKNKSQYADLSYYIATPSIPPSQLRLFFCLCFKISSIFFSLLRSRFGFLFVSTLPYP
jgi:hypothetical protein